MMGFLMPLNSEHVFEQDLGRQGLMQLLSTKAGRHFAFVPGYLMQHVATSMSAAWGIERWVGTRFGSCRMA